MRKNKPMPKDFPRGISAAAAARAVGLSASTLARAVRAGKVRSWQTPGGHHRVLLEDVQKLVGLS